MRLRMNVRDGGNDEDGADAADDGLKRNRHAHSPNAHGRFLRTRFWESTGLSAMAWLVLMISLMMIMMWAGHADNGDAEMV